MTHTEGKEFLEAAFAASFAEANGEYRFLCLGLEAALGDLKVQGLAIDLLTLDFFHDGVKLGAVRFLPSIPADYQTTGCWTVFYTSVIPRQIPWGHDPLHVKRLTVGYNRDPVVQYDGEPDNGLPVRFNRPYQPKRVLKDNLPSPSSLMPGAPSG